MELLLDPQKQYSYADYLTWLDDKRRELINGYIREMTTPYTQHQRISVNLVSELLNVIRKNKLKCRIYPRIDVRLPKNGEKEDNQINTVVQPDICIVCDSSKLLDERSCLGAPDFIVEIQSPSTAKYDLTEKFNLYESFGVCEYWVVFPFDEAIQVFILQPDGKYDKGTLYEAYRTGKIPIHIFNDIEIDLKKIFF
jgi:Uma2 family endonuclease